MKVILLKGLPASGKSTYAKKLAQSGYTRVNKDDLRAMLDNGKWTKDNEKLVLKIRDEIIVKALEAGKSVVVDDTNLHPKHAEQIKTLIRPFGATFETKMFEVTVEEAIKRDLAREKSVGADVIKGMYNQFLRPPVPVPQYVSDAPWAIICDIDGTLADMRKGEAGRRGPFDWARVGEDDLVREVAFVVERFKMNDSPIQVIMLSGRDSVCRTETEAWLEKHQIKYDHLFMRAEGDMRKDTIIKEELYREHIEGKFNIEFVLDDRDQVVDMWRNKIGLKVFQVAEGDF